MAGIFTIAVLGGYHYKIRNVLTLTLNISSIFMVKKSCNAGKVCAGFFEMKFSPQRHYRLCGNKRQRDKSVYTREMHTNEFLFVAIIKRVLFGTLMLFGVICFGGNSVDFTYVFYVTCCSCFEYAEAVSKSNGSTVHSNEKNVDKNIFIQSIHHVEQSKLTM